MINEKLSEQFSSVLEENIGIIVKISRAYAATIHDREDLVNDILLELWKSFKNFKGNSKISTWIYRVALNTSLNYKRKKKNDLLFYHLSDFNKIDNLSWLIEQDHSQESEILYKCIDELTSIRSTIDFYIGVSLFTVLFILACIFRIKFFLMAGSFNFSNSVSSVKKGINELEKYQFKMLRIALLIILPLGLISIFLIAKIPFLTQDTLIPLSLMIIILTVSFIYKTKYSYEERFRKLNQEIEEIEELERE
jgi:RNA polymerase sigma-70 factor, ECF subfamily